MQTLNQFSQSNTFENNIEELVETIQEFEVPDSVKTKLIEIINEHEFEIAEYQYQSLVSDNEDYQYEKMKEEKYFKDDN